MKWYNAIPITALALLAACSDGAPTALAPRTPNAPRFFAGTSQNLTGAIFTSVEGCGKTNVNIYDIKQNVYLNGGPEPGGNQNLPDGKYYVQITDPSGATLLGTSVGAADETPFVVVDGLGNCLKLYDALIRPNKAQGYDDTPNNGGEYKVWISKASDFNNDAGWKTDNFKVRRDENCTDCVNEIPDITVEKSAASGTVTVGNAVSYSIKVSSVGTVDAQNVSLSDPLPTNVAGLSWSIPSNGIVTDPSSQTAPSCAIASNTLSCNPVTLAVGASYTVTVTSSTGAGCGTIKNTASGTFDVPVDGGGTIQGQSSSQEISITISGCPQLHVRKFYDANGDGAFNGTDTWLTGWPMAVTGPSAYSSTNPTNVDLTGLGLGSYGVTEGASTTGTWTQSAKYWFATATPSTTSTTFPLSLIANDDKTVVFGNYCTNAAAGWTLGFWSNNNGQARLSGFNVTTGNYWQDLVGVPTTVTTPKTGAGFGTAIIGGQSVSYKLWQAKPNKLNQLVVTQFLLSGYTGSPSTSKSAATISYFEYQNWLLSAQASSNGSALYMLSAQFSAAVSNAVIGGTDVKLDVSATLPGTGKTIKQIMVYVATLLNTATPGTDRSEYTTYIGYLNQINNKAAVIPATPCARTFAP